MDLRGRGRGGGRAPPPRRPPGPEWGVSQGARVRSALTATPGVELARCGSCRTRGVRTGPPGGTGGAARNRRPPRRRRAPPVTCLPRPSVGACSPASWQGGHTRRAGREAPRVALWPKRILSVAEVRMTSRPQRFVRGEACLPACWQGSRARQGAGGQARTLRPAQGRLASAGLSPRALPRGANRRPSRTLPADCAFLHGVRPSYATHRKAVPGAHGASGGANLG